MKQRQWKAVVTATAGLLVAAPLALGHTSGDTDTGSCYGGSCTTKQKPKCLAGVASAAQNAADSRPARTKMRGKCKRKFRGTAGDDTYSGTVFMDWARGARGNDTLSGGANDDRLRGGPGDDTLDGGDGNDDIRTGWGTDSAAGGDGDDRIKATQPDGQVDTIDCGAGTDKAKVRPEDVTTNCEVVHVLSSDETVAP